MNPTARICPACHQPLPADAPQGLCPQCLAKSALGSQPGSDETLASGSKPGGSGPAAIQPEIARLFPQFEILEPLGQGGMGMVYKARQPQLDRIVALKVLRGDLSRDPAFAERFAREARALAKLNHPNIVSVFDFGQTGGHCWILMEFVDGTNLRELLRTKTLKPREALGIVPKVCDALQYAHDEGIVHRDIKPENILLDKKGRVKIADFGLAKLVGKDASEFSLTATGMTLGTPRYMAPEQFDKPQEVDHRADIYSLGVVLYEMLTGEVPMGRFSLPSATIGVDVRLDEVVLRTLEKEPSRRYQHASEVKTQVENISGVIASLPPTMRHAFGFDYKSKTELFGLPLVHLCSGMDPATGQCRRARGIIAIGDIAKGVFAFGGMATGIFAFGGMAVGVFAVGGLAFGAVTLGGLAVALLVAYGGLSIAPVALGGYAIGYYACGGAGWGAHIAAANGSDPEGRRFFEWLFSYLGGGWGRLNAAALLLSFGSMALSFGAMAWAKQKVASTQAAADALTRTGTGRSGTATTEAPKIAAKSGLFTTVVVATMLLLAAGGTAAGLVWLYLQKAKPQPADSRPAVHGVTSAGQPASLVAKPNFTGTWKLQSTNTAEVFTFEHTEGNLRVIMRIDDSLSQRTVALEGPIDGVEHQQPVLGPAAAFTAGWQGTELIWDFKRTSEIGPMRNRREMKLSADGKTITARRTRFLPRPEGVWTETWDRQDGDGRSGASATAPVAADILRQMAEKYAALSTFSASGTVVSEITPAGGGAATKLEHTFSLNLARPEFYRVEWTNVVIAGFTMKGAAWSAGEGHKVLIGDKVSTFLNRELALGAATGVSGGVAHTVPGLFFKDADGLLKSLTNPSLLAEESLGADLCHVITGDGRAGKTTLWITKKDLLLKKYQTATGAGSGKGIAQAAEEASDETLRKLLKTMGQEATPEAVSKMRKQMASTAKMVGTMRIVSTQTYDKIVANGLMIKEDFEVTVPPGAAAPPAQKP